MMINGTAGGGRAPSPPTPPPPAVVDKTLCAACDIMKLLPTGTVLAFHELAPSFTNHGRACGAASRLITTALVASCAASCVLLSFTDSLVSHADGRLYYGVATRRGFRPFNFEGSRAEMEARFGDLPGMKVRAIDFVHALVSALVFVAVALGNAEVQGCLFPDAGEGFRDVFMNLPVALGLMSSMLFMIFPTTRKSIGYTDMMPRKEDGRKGGAAPGLSTASV